MSLSYQSFMTCLLNTPVQSFPLKDMHIHCHMTTPHRAELPAAFCADELSPNSIAAANPRHTSSEWMMSLLYTQHETSLASSLNDSMKISNYVHTSASTTRRRAARGTDISIIRTDHHSDLSNA